MVSVEIDPAFARMAEDALPAKERVLLLHADALKNKNELNPDLLRAVTDLQQRLHTTQLKLVANLPYAVAVPVITNLLLTDLPVERMVVMVQWEIAERLTAVVGQKAYAALAVLMQSLADVAVVRRLPSGGLLAAAAGRFGHRADPPQRGEAAAGRGRGAACATSSATCTSTAARTCAAALVGSPTHEISKAEVDAKLAALGIDGTTRAEALDVEQHLRLCEVFG